MLGNRGGSVYVKDMTAICQIIVRKFPGVRIPYPRLVRPASNSFHLFISEHNTDDVR